MGKEDLGMNEFIFFAICFICMALCLTYRLIKGPKAADRMISADAIDMTVDMALILFALYTGRSIYIDIALVTAIFGFISTLLVSRYLEGRL